MIPVHEGEGGFPPPNTPKGRRGGGEKGGERERERREERREEGERERERARGRKACVFGGVLLYYICMISPIRRLARYIFSGYHKPCTRSYNITIVS